MVFGAFFVNFRISSFFVFSTFVKKKTFVLKAQLLSLYEKKSFRKCFEILICVTHLLLCLILASPIFHFFHVWEISPLCFWTLFLANFLPFSVSSLFFFSSSFNSRFFVSLSCESSILFTSLFKKKNFSCFSLSFLSFIFFSFILDFFVVSVCLPSFRFLVVYHFSLCFVLFGWICLVSLFSCFYFVQMCSLTKFLIFHLFWTYSFFWCLLFLTRLSSFFVHFSFCAFRCLQLLHKNGNLSSLFPRPKKNSLFC